MHGLVRRIPEIFSINYSQHRGTVTHIKLYQSIDEILWTEWDPIKVNDVAPRDEYQIYTPTILNLKIKGADPETIANKLHDIETKTIGVLGDITKCRTVAEKISNL